MATVATAALAVAASIIGSADAPSAGANALSRTRHVNTKTLVLTGPAKPTPGDRLDFYEKDSGGDTGHDYAECIVMNAQGEALCHVEFVLKHGDISGDAVININATTLNGAGPIIGGTGSYNGARGTVAFNGPATSTSFTFRFVAQ
ncbi:MAG: hypothetical protein ACYDHH_02205 [Solirubrobacteraceae bacterium]